MTKKINYLILTILCAVLVFSLASCKKKNKEQNTDKDKEEPKIDLTEDATIANSYLQGLEENSGYKIVYETIVSENGKSINNLVTFATSKDVYMIVISGIENSANIFDVSGSSFVSYSKEGNENKWTKIEENYGNGFTKEQAKTSFSNLFALTTSYLTYYKQVGANGEVFVKGETVDIAGKTCTEYTYTLTNALGQDTDFSYKFYVNDETGLCLKVVTSGNTDNGHGSLSFECKEFTTPYTITLPTSDEIADDGELEGPDNPITISTPIVTIDEEGFASWYIMNGVASSYTIKINGVEMTTPHMEYQLNKGDTIQVMANGDGINYISSKWSDVYTSQVEEKIYDFSNIGLTDSQVSNLIKLFEKEVGSYRDGLNLVCENGDLIAYDGTSYIHLFSKENGYIRRTLVSNYTMDTTTQKTTDYYYVDYCDNKKAYYEDVLTKFIALTAFSKDEGSKIVTDGEAFIESLDIKLLGFNEYDKTDQKAYELESYQEYSGEIKKEILNTKYLYETRSLSFLDNYTSKIDNWALDRVNINDNYSDNQVTVVFNEDFTFEDYKNILELLKSKNLQANEGIDFPTTEQTLNMFTGYIPVYTFPYEEENDSYLADEYTFTGMNIEGFYQPYTLTIKYTYLYWFDGGTNATYVVHPTGLWRVFDEYKQLMIEPNGNTIEYIKSPKSTLENFAITYTMDAEYDEELKQNDQVVTEYHFEKIGKDTVRYEKSEYNYDYIVTHEINNSLYYRSGYKALEDETFEWSDIDTTNTVFDNYGEIYDLLCCYFEKQFICEKKSTTTYLDLKVNVYEYTDNDSTFELYVTEDGVTLKIIETTSENVTITKQVLSFQRNITGFTSISQTIFTNSDLSNYRPE